MMFPKLIQVEHGSTLCQNISDREIGEAVIIDYLQEEICGRSENRETVFIDAMVILRINT